MLQAGASPVAATLSAHLPATYAAATSLAAVSRLPLPPPCRHWLQVPPTHACCALRSAITAHTTLPAEMDEHGPAGAPAGAPAAAGRPAAVRQQRGWLLKGPACAVAVQRTHQSLKPAPACNLNPTSCPPPLLLRAAQVGAGAGGQGGGAGGGRGGARGQAARAGECGPLAAAWSAAGPAAAAVDPACLALWRSACGCFPAARVQRPNCAPLNPPPCCLRLRRAS